MQLILLAAGKGTRLPVRLRRKPKCMVEINKKKLIDINLPFYKKFNSKIIVTGYKKNLLSKFIKKNNFTEVFNQKFKSTNMVHSLFRTFNKINQDIIFCYGDIIVNKKLYHLLKCKENILPVYTDWLKLWKSRMKIKDVYKDAEDLKINKNYLESIGGKINLKLPKYQYMGLAKIKKKDFYKLHKFYKKIKNKKIDMTSFLNLSVKNKIIKFKIKRYSYEWFEIDNLKDINVASKYIKS